MFDTCDWNDNIEAQRLTHSLVTAERRKPAGTQEKGATSRRKRLKRNRQLLDLLQTLNTSSGGDHDIQPPRKPKSPLLPDLPPPDAPTLDDPPPDAPTLESPPPDATSLESPPPDSGNRLSRQQWRNRMKNRKKSRNKYKPETEAQEQEGTEGAATRTGDWRNPPQGDEEGGSVGGCGRRMDPRGKARLKKMVQQEDGAEAKSEAAGEGGAESLRSRMVQRLSSARFRYINQQLYTSDSQDALRLFQSDPEAFAIYHTGFSQQVQRWPVNPVTEIIKYIKHRPAALVVADFGCGDAVLARSVRNKVHSFDLVALNDHVTVCDIAQVPLSDESVDIGVFCLSLMGKNLADFLREANRVLKPGGTLLVAEVSSRFEDIRPFLSAMSLLGFRSINKSTDSRYFFLFQFCKTGPSKKVSQHPGLQLKACLYKKR